MEWSTVVDQIRDGNPEGEETLYRELHSGARLFLQRRLGTNDVEDRIHDMFLIVIQTIRRGELRQPERLMSFIRTVLYRQLNSGISRLIDERATSAAIDAIASLSSREPDPEQQVLSQERVDAMQKGMKKMKAKDVEILTRYYLRGQPPDRICAEMALTLTQFTLRKSRAKARLTALMPAAASRAATNQR